MEAEFEQMWLQMADHERHSDVYNVSYYHHYSRDSVKLIST